MLFNYYNLKVINPSKSLRPEFEIQKVIDRYYILSWTSKIFMKLLTRFSCSIPDFLWQIKKLKDYICGFWPAMVGWPTMNKQTNNNIFCMTVYSSILQTHIIFLSIVGKTTHCNVSQIPNVNQKVRFANNGNSYPHF